MKCYFGSGVAGEPAEPDQLVAEARVRRVPSARIRQDEHARAAEALRLGAAAAAGRRPEEPPVDREADEGDDVGLRPGDGPRESPAAEDHLVGADLGGLPGGAADDIGDGEPELRQPHVVDPAERLGDEPRGMKEAPERIARSREVMTERPRAETGVDADEEDPGPPSDAVGERPHRRDTGGRARRPARQHEGFRSGDPPQPRRSQLNLSAGLSSRLSRRWHRIHLFPQDDRAAWETIASFSSSVMRPSATKASDI